MVAKFSNDVQVPTANVVENACPLNATSTTKARNAKFRLRVALIDVPLPLKLKGRADKPGPLLMLHSTFMLCSTSYVLRFCLVTVLGPGPGWLRFHSESA